ncbi:MAG: peptide-methionine (S)-S-oxide reductase MsrA [Anaerolineae bacterium]|jgi:peptide-methionine (S)-S-oxide reductase|nr:peptide-methionine (S)-S-oxide reductase MsrA [Anaerolineae bacterium]MBT7072538.1 peptide-methionine (S)-S-oxide reductase MsrA [Anaerolineae bacterium]MBT7323652.1 peptide-methionine (S)-S-oxide reductase MsrA [Anaerolineae bacterium]
MPQEIATLAGGCFWCLEAVYADLKGVVQVESGYSGGSVPNPGYQAVCTGETGHAEVVQVTFDPDVISLDDLLRVFFAVHDPTTLNRQGADVGTQYRSAIFTHSDAQKATAERIMAEMASQWKDPIVTEISPIENYYAAEDYHQEYFANNPSQPYCRAVVAPKVEKFRKKFEFKLK